MAQECGWVLVSTKKGSKPEKVAKAIKKTYLQYKGTGKEENDWWVIRADEVSGKGPVAGYHIVVSAVVKVNTTLQKVAEQIKGIKVDGNTPVDYSLPLTVSKHHPNNLIKYDAPDPDADDASGSGDGEGPENAWG